MTKGEFENLLRQAGKIAKDQEFYVIGSQSLRGVCPAIPRDFPQTFEADLYPCKHPQAWSLLRAGLGNQSRFFKRHGYYVDCTDPALATLPDGWTERLIAYRTPRTGGVTAWCLDPHDLFVSKLAVGRGKDLEFLSAMLRHRLVRSKAVLLRIDEVSVSRSSQQAMKDQFSRILREARSETGARKFRHRR